MAGGLGHVTTGEKIKDRLSKAKHTKAAELDKLLGLIARQILASAGANVQVEMRFFTSGGYYSFFRQPRTDPNEFILAANLAARAQIDNF